MKHLLLFIAFISLFFSIATAQVTDAEKTLRTDNTDTTKGWKKGGIISLTGANTELYNWAAGGDNTLSGNGLISYYINYKSPTTAWDNLFDFGYGKARQGEKGKPFIKTDDKIDILSKYGRKAYKSFYYAALINFKTQFDEGKKYSDDTTFSIISNFMAPAYITGAIGIDYKPNKYLSAFIAPVTARYTIVTDQTLADAGSFGVTAATYAADGITKLSDGENIRKEFGGYVRVIITKNDFTQELLKNVSLTSKVDLFSNYLQDPQNVDVSWENQIAFKINKFITVNFNTHLINDADTKNVGIDTNNDGTDDKMVSKVQFKQILGVGFSYKF
ncbi:MAG: hypothetical protein BWY22_01932 [Bacteroidetes bacterium ADurb.Bin217]|nr:MAG: hypothetical protein BWY22_01932 [Bacteroidetes bacterium ADurb.Bin217]